VAPFVLGRGDRPGHPSFSPLACPGPARRRLDLLAAIEFLDEEATAKRPNGEADEGPNHEEAGSHDRPFHDFFSPR
jgi:hypothetical protein